MRKTSELTYLCSVDDEGRVEDERRPQQAHTIYSGRYLAVREHEGKRVLFLHSSVHRGSTMPDAKVYAMLGPQSVLDFSGPIEIEAVYRGPARILWVRR